MSFSLTLKQVLESTNTTAAQLSARTGFSMEILRLWLKGERIPTVRSVNKICLTLDLAPQYKEVLTEARMHDKIKPLLKHVSSTDDAVLNNLVNVFFLYSRVEKTEEYAYFIKDEFKRCLTNNRPK